KCAWEELRPHGNDVPWFHTVWFSHAIPRHAFQLWLVMRRALKTQDKLRTWDVDPTTDLSQLRCVAFGSWAGWNGSYPAGVGGLLVEEKKINVQVDTGGGVNKHHFSCSSPRADSSRSCRSRFAAFSKHVHVELAFADITPRTVDALQQNQQKYI
nr:reverse transcriptase domain, reverse transcriptase zinc-binding domain protein [Tanacetum cinerariifolium]